MIIVLIKKIKKEEIIKQNYFDYSKAAEAQEKSLVEVMEEEKITKEQGEEFANEINAKFLSFSAKTDSTYELDNFLEDLLKDYIKVNGLDEDEEENEGIIRLKREPKYEVIYRTVTVWEKCCLCCYCPRRLKFRLYRRPDGTTTCCRPH